MKTIRIPAALVYSCRHTAVAVATYGLIALHGTRSRDELAARLSVSLRTLDNALRSLGVARSSPGQVHPVYVETQRRPGLTALRSANAHKPHIAVPARTLGDIAGPLVPHTAWRLYLALVDQVNTDGSCQLPAKKLAEQISVCRQAIGAFLWDLETAGLVKQRLRAGAPTVVFPLLDLTGSTR